ncbi:FAD-binding oxidoreductase [Aspergillus mulundensis]|uniref:FAD binding protein n=1 Tax=Aspergillus mulundensis TaxID=1810919 RepID=A0A3D8RRP8_9EURO|nr:FAD binding protein [Aspergillus mulundensis]RDW76544.1 FAD binding protein [Aspergillus mulundensis]
MLSFLQLMRLLSTLIALIASATCSTNSEDPFNFRALFSPGTTLSSEANVYLPGDAAYSSTNERWSELQSPSYAAAIQPATEEDVAYIVRTAVANNISFLATGSAHSVKPGYTSIRDGINIDLRLLNDLSIDHTGETVTVGAGVTNDPVYNAVYGVQKEVPITTERCLSTIGTMVGGGLGVMQTIHGCLADSLISARVVTATGEILTVSQASHPDLFWAIRGAGANFGIVVSATFQLYDQTNGGRSLDYSFLFSHDQAGSVFELMHSLDDVRGTGAFWSIWARYNHTTKEATLTLRLIVLGNEADAKPHVRSAQALNPRSESVIHRAWNTYGEPTDELCGHGWNAEMWNSGLERTDVPVLVEMWNEYVAFAAEREWFNGFWLFERDTYEGLNEVPEDRRGVGYPWRDTVAYLGFINYIDDARYEDEVHAFIRPLRERLQETMGYEQRRAYVGEAYGDEGPAVWYGAHNLPRLVALKQQWDPEARFGAGMPVPLSLDE